MLKEMIVKIANYLEWESVKFRGVFMSYLYVHNYTVCGFFLQSFKSLEEPS